MERLLQLQKNLIDVDAKAYHQILSTVTEFNSRQCAHGVSRSAFSKTRGKTALQSMLWPFLVLAYMALRLISLHGLSKASAIDVLLAIALLLQSGPVRCLGTLANMGSKARVSFD
jgi:hypothetical protein